MQIKDIIQTGAAIFIGLGLFFFGGGYLISRYKGGSKEEKAESRDLVSSNEQIKQFYKEQNEDYKQIIKEQNLKIEGLTKEVGEIQGQLRAEKRQNDELKLIFQNRNPEMEEFMKFMVQATKDQAGTQKEMVRILGEIHTMSKAEHDRDFKVEATVTKT